MIDALRRNSSVDFVHVRHEEYGAFAAAAEAGLTGQPVAVCGTAGPGVVHLINGQLDARHERAPVIAIAGDVESSVDRGGDAGRAGQAPTIKESSPVAPGASVARQLFRNRE